MAFPRGSARTAATLALFLALVPAHALASPGDLAREYVERNKRAFGLSGGDVSEVTVSSIVPSAHNGITHVYLQQELRGIGVHNALFTVSLRKDGSVLSASGRFVARVAALAGGQSARKAAAEAAGVAARGLGLSPRGAIQAVSRRGGPENATTLTDGGISARPIEAQLAWLPKDGAVRLAWRVEIETVDGQHNWLAFVDAEKGTLLAAEDLVVHDDSVATGEAIARPAGAPAAGLSFDDIDGSSYRVFALPFESPLDGDRTLVSGAADPAASPYGWHDTNASPGPEFTVTRGNNVHAYTDVDANGIPDPGSDPDGGAGLDFDLPLDLSMAPPAYRPAAVANLFYWNNVIHDVTAGYGFDEASGNFQVTNYSGATGGGDDVRAEAQDGSGTNNANFNTPAQNHPTQPRPRMQMFVWNDPRGNKVSVASGPAAGDHEASSAVFGPPLTATGITGETAVVDDGVIGAPVPPSTVPGTLNDGCEPFGGVAGKIAMVERGYCGFVIKVKNAQNAGAIAVIVGNNAPGLPVTMGGADPTITIPSVMVSNTNYALLRDNSPLTATLRNAPRTPRDSDLDAGVIAHEYGHGISNRLTGGPNNVTCLQNAEQMGEGWSDFYALVMTTHPSDTKVTARGIGPYVNFEAPDGFGIRPTQYTTDMAINPSTYASVANTAITQPHGIGYVWNTMLWEMYWNLVDRYGYNADIYAPWDEGGNNLTIQLVTDGMKIQPCSPGFVDGRNGILSADSALTGGANQCEIWRAFAKRGLGAGASQGSSNNRFDGVPAFDLPASCTAAVFGGFLPPIQAPPAVNEVDAGDVVPVRFSLSGDDPTLDSQAVDCTSLVPTGEPPSPLATPGNTGIRRRGDTYQVNWLTDAAWAGTCRRLTLRIAAPSDPVAYFRFD